MTLALQTSRTVPVHMADRARLLERARILLSTAVEALIMAEAFEAEAGPIADALDGQLPRLRALVDRFDPH